MEHIEQLAQLVKIENINLLVTPYLHAFEIVPSYDHEELLTKVIKKSSKSITSNAVMR